MGNASNARVTNGIRGALKELGLLRGFVPIDAFDEDVDYPGALAEIGVMVGPYPLVRLMRHGFHKRRYLIVAPNSTWVPSSLVEIVESHAEAVGPSRWAAVILECYLEQPWVSVWRHGVDQGFKPDPEAHELLEREYKKGVFRVLHLSSSALQRKGTWELLRGWKKFLLRTELEPRLAIGLDHSSPDMEEYAEEHLRGTVNWLGHVGGDVAKMAELYQSFHVVCQPSRGEGFGMVPLEARACGIPICATSCTGHAEHVGLKLFAPEMGVSIIEHGRMDDIDDGPGARAPAVASSEIRRALDRFELAWNDFHCRALGKAEAVRQDWSWRAVTEKWLKEERIQ